MYAGASFGLDFNKTGAVVRAGDYKAIQNLSMYSNLSLWLDRNAE